MNGLGLTYLLTLCNRQRKHILCLDHLCEWLVSGVAVCLVVLFLLTLSSCSSDDGADVPTPTKKEIVHTVAVVAPVGDAATKSRLERTAQWFGVEVFKEARCGQLNDEYYWYDQWKGFSYLTYQSAINLKKNKHEYFWGEREKTILFNQNRKTDVEVLNDHAVSLNATAGSPTVKDEGYNNLFDRNKDTKWTSNSKKDGVWYVEFQSVILGTPSKYKLTTGNDTKKLSDRSPVSWKLYGKHFISDGWKLMDEVTNGGLPIDNKKTKEYTIANQGTYQYYRFEVSKNTGSTHVQLDGFDFVY